MNYLLSPQTFSVIEQFNPKLIESGRYYYYILQKKGVSHSQAVKRIGARCFFTGIKDKNASTTQWFCTDEKIENINEEDFNIKFKGCSNQRIHVGEHKGNLFKVIVELDSKELEALRYFKPKKELVSNYFGSQRFGSNNALFCNALSTNNFEDALKIFLTKESKQDTPKSTKIKELIKSNWGNWKQILENEEIKGTGKVGLFEYLLNNPNDYEGAFAYAEPKSLSIMIKACQAQRFNESLNKLALEKKPNNYISQISGQFGDYALGASKAFKRSLIIQPTEFEKKIRKSTLERRTFFAAQKFKTKRTENNQFELCFELDKGQYATVFLKFLKTWLEKNKK